MFDHGSEVNADNTLNWIRLDARRSKARRGTIQSYTYEITVAGTGADVHGPGATTTPIAHVLLSPGSYVASVTVTDHRGARDTRTRRIRIRGKAAANFNPGRVQWAFDEDWRVGDAAITIAFPLSASAAAACASSAATAAASRLCSTAAAVCLIG